jgi:thiamine transporter
LIEFTFREKEKMESKTLNSKTLRLVESGVMIALATILSLIVLFKMPQGGSVTLCSSLPIIIISYRYGAKWGIFTGLVYGLLQLLFGLSDLKGVSAVTVVGSMFLDFLFAFGALGFAGFFRKLPFGLAIGAFVGNLCRGIISFISGVILWSNILKDGLWPSIVYSFVYNFGGYMIWEIITTTLVAAMISGVLLVIDKKPFKNI